MVRTENSSCSRLLVVYESEAPNTPLCVAPGHSRAGSTRTQGRAMRRRHVEVTVTPSWSEPVSACHRPLSCEHHGAFKADTLELTCLCDGPLSRQAHKVRLCF